MSVVIGVVLSLIVLACLVATALQIHCSRLENLQNKDKFRDETNVYSSNDSMSSGEKNREGYMVDKIIANQNNTLAMDGEEREPDLIAQATSGKEFEHSDLNNADSLEFLTRFMTRDSMNG
jgi:hypothetical protein